MTRATLRIGDAERDQAAASLGEHFASGRLDHEEHAERLTAVFAARTWGDLTPIFRDLPPSTAERRPSPDRRPPARVPFLPVLLILVGVAALTGHGFLIWLGLGLLLLLRRRGRGRGYASGSRRAPRGSWS